MDPKEYKRRCQALGYSTQQLASIFGLTPRGLTKRWDGDQAIRVELVLALEGLEHRRMVYRSDLTLRRHCPPAVAVEDEMQLGLGLEQIRPGTGNAVMDN